MQSNPIQQRIDLICDEWEDAKKHSKARIVRIHCQDDESDMVDCFYTYMIGTDSPIQDIAFHFESACLDQREFSESLLKELEEIIYIWNESQKDERIEFVPVHWKADCTSRKDKNPAALFVHNFNMLAKSLALPKDLYTVAIFRSGIVNKQFAAWLKSAMEAEIDSTVKFLIHDTVSQPHFDSLAFDSPFIITTIPLNLNMPKAMEQCAAMGDPNDPATFYRQAFMKMMNAMGAQKEKEAEKWGKECIKQATENLSRDPYWIMQVIVVHVALGNDKMRYKKKDQALEHATKAVEAATAARNSFDNENGSILLAQALMFRGTLLFLDEKWEDAHPDLSEAYTIYKKQGNFALAVEACRMAGKSAMKNSENSRAAEILAEGTKLGKNIDSTIARASTFAGLLEILLETKYTKFISLEEIDEIAMNIYGPDWNKIVNNWKKVNQNEMQHEEVE